MPNLQARRRLIMRRVAPVAVAAYVGPGDVVSGAQMWGSSARAYNAAYAAGATKHAIDIVDSGGANPAIIDILTTGFIDVAALTTWIGLHGTASVTKLYDQTGNSNHWTNATVASMPTITMSSLNGLPGMTGVAASNTFLQAPATLADISTACFLTSVHKKTGTAAQECALGFSSSGALIGSGTVANTIQLSGNTTSFQVGSIADNTFHSAIGLINGASSVLNIDGAETTGTTDTFIPTGSAPRVLRGNGGGTMDGSVMEVGLWLATISAPNRALLNSNLHGSSGYNF